MLCDAHSGTEKRRTPHSAAQRGERERKWTEPGPVRLCGQTAGTQNGRYAVECYTSNVMSPGIRSLRHTAQHPTLLPPYFPSLCRSMSCARSAAAPESVRCSPKWLPCSDQKPRLHLCTEPQPLIRPGHICSSSWPLNLTMRACTSSRGSS